MINGGDVEKLWFTILTISCSSYIAKFRFTTKPKVEEISMSHFRSI